jgi:hypothetical protein
MYFTPAAQTRILAKLHFALRPAGFLALGIDLDEIDRWQRRQFRIQRTHRNLHALIGGSGDGCEKRRGRRVRRVEEVDSELERDHGPLPPTRVSVSGRGDGIALGEWVHGGDVREALEEPLPYASDGIEDALVLLVERSQARAVPPTRVSLPDRQLLLGVAADTGRPPAELVTDPATLVRLCSGRRPDPARFTLRGADPDRYQLFG